MKKSIISLAFAVLLVLGFLSCNKNEAPPLEPINGSVVFKFENVVDGEKLEFNDIKYVNAFGNVYSVATLKYFVSDIILKRSDGKEVYFDMEHYVDGQDPKTMVYQPDLKIPVGSYSSVSFIFGLNEKKNVGGIFPNPPENNMEWPLPLGGGYHYMKLEGKIENPGGIKNFQGHTGPTNGNQNYITVTFPGSDFVIDSKETTLAITMNINKWWANPNTLDLNEMTGIMGDQAVQTKLHDNGMDVFSLKIYQPDS